MNNNIKLEFKKNTDATYNVVCRFGLEGQEEDKILEATVRSFNPNRYVAYQKACRKQYRKTRLDPKYIVVQTQQDLDRIKQDLDKSAANVLRTMNNWGGLPQFDEIAKAIDSRSENLRVAISTECTDLRRLPLHKWELFPDDVEVVFSRIKAQKPNRERHPDRIRILVILGNDKDISKGIKKDKEAIEEYCKEDAELVLFLTQPDRAKLTATLADPDGWDIIFFSGHSDTDEKNVGRIQINANDSLSMVELEEVLAPAIAKRVQIAIFNSCDGLGITPTLEKLDIDRLIVMREPIPDFIAQEFLKSFLQAFTGGARFDDAVKSARQQLVEFEDKYPYASWLPIVIQNRLVPAPTWQSLGKIRSPYKGLEAFTEADAANFYGREETIERYARLVTEYPLMPIIGASGSGKSSLVQAGLIPFLKRDTKCKWQILNMRPGRNPFSALAKAIFKVDSPRERLRQRANLESTQLDLDLASDCHILTQKLAQIRLSDEHRILLFIDQFEELFTQSDNEAARQVFLQSLADAVSNAPNFVLVFTLRNDFLPTLQSDRQDKDFRQVLEQYAPQLLGGMTDHRLRAAITKPVEQLGVEFEGGLIDRLLKDIGTADGSLPLLQLVLDLLWKNVQKRQLTHECYEKIGGKEGMKTILVKLADDIYGGFAKDGKEKEFKQVFLRLVTIGDASILNTRRIATRQEIGEANWQKIVLPLSAARLLKTNLNEQDEEIVEVIHEILIQSWQQLVGWIDKHRQELERIGEIETAAIKWDNGKRSEQDLWGGKKLKEIHKFSKNDDRLITFSQIASIFLTNSIKQQRQTEIKIAAILMILPGTLLVREILILSSLKTIVSIDRNQYDSRLSTTLRLLGILRYKVGPLELYNRNLSNADLSGIDLSKANFMKADLSKANLKNADLSGVDLKSANLSGADLSGADLSGADLSDADLNGADFRSADSKRTDINDIKNDFVSNFRDIFTTSLPKGDDIKVIELKITPEQVKLAKNWQKAKYPQEFRKQLGLK
jgi:hypothetical protein